MVKNKVLSKKQLKAFEQGLNDPALSNIFTKIEIIDRQLHTQGQKVLTGELAEMWDQLMFNYSKIDDIGSLVDKISEGLHEADLPAETKAAYFKLLDCEKRLLSETSEKDICYKDNSPS